MKEKKEQNKLLTDHCFFFVGIVRNRTFVQKSKFFDNTNLSLSKPHKKSNGGNNFPLRATSFYHSNPNNFIISKYKIFFLIFITNTKC